MATGNHTISLAGGTKLPQTRRFNQLWKWYQNLAYNMRRLVTLERMAPA
jgi:hypothetical protein